jgi:hypothetical protein
MNLDNLNNVCPVPRNLDLPSTVYKYRAVNENLFSSLLLNQVWLAKPETFNDPFESVRIFSGSAFSLALARSVREAGVLCLCKRNDNLAMWSHYGNALKGIAVGYDLARLVGSLAPIEPIPNEYSTPRWRYVYDMNYNDDGLTLIQEMDLLRNDPLTEGERQKMFATKAAVFTHEEECRVVVEPSSDQPEIWPEDTWSGHGLYRHTPDAIKEIVFGELVAEQDRQDIMKIMAGRDVAFLDAVRKKNSFQIQVKSASQHGVPSSTDQP